MIGSHYNINEIPKCESVTHTIYSSNVCVDVEIYSYVCKYIAKCIAMSLCITDVKRFNMVECQETVVIEILATGHRISNRLGESLSWVDETRPWHLEFNGLRLVDACSLNSFRGQWLVASKGHRKWRSYPRCKLVLSTINLYTGNIFIILVILRNSTEGSYLFCFHFNTCSLIFWYSNLLVYDWKYVEEPH